MNELETKIEKLELLLQNVKEDRDASLKHLGNKLHVMEKTHEACKLSLALCKDDNRLMAQWLLKLSDTQLYNIGVTTDYIEALTEMANDV